MRGLKLCLYVSGVLFLLGLLGMFLPISTWQSVAAFFKVESTALAESSVAEYMLRIALAMSAIIGAYLVILARNPMKYPLLVPFTAIAILFLGLACLTVGLIAAMSPMWYLGDAISCLILGILILTFWKKAKANRTM